MQTGSLETGFARPGARRRIGPSGQRTLKIVGSDTLILPEIEISEQAVAGGPTS
jgi:hypothetical protein